jgi:ABC-type transporter Mla maintaining outer membrane lipid asymmetry ATPase subunit MlaF
MIHALRATGIVPLLRGLGPFTLEVPRGAIVCLLGRQALVRSAYMRVLAGAQYPHSGDVEILGARLSELDDRSWLALRRHVGFVTREASLVSSMDGLRNVMLPALYHSLGSRSEVEERACGLLERLGFTGDHHALPAFLSEAERKVLALARALVLEPTLLLVDDPLTGMQGHRLREVAHAIGRWCREKNAALVYATDDISFVRDFSDQVVFIAPPVPHLFSSWEAFRKSNAREVRHYRAWFREEAKVFD